MIRSFSVRQCSHRYEIPFNLACLHINTQAYPHCQHYILSYPRDMKLPIVIGCRTDDNIFAVSFYYSPSIYSKKQFQVIVSTGLTLLIAFRTNALTNWRKLCNGVGVGFSLNSASIVKLQQQQQQQQQVYSV